MLTQEPRLSRGESGPTSISVPCSSMCSQSAQSPLGQRKALCMLQTAEQLRPDPQVAFTGDKAAVQQVTEDIEVLKVAT